MVTIIYCITVPMFAFLKRWALLFWEAVTCPLVFIPFLTWLMWVAAIHCFFPCMFIAGFVIGPCQDLGISHRHQLAYFCTAMFGCICFIISRARPLFFTTFWFTIPFFFLMGFYLSWMLCEEEKKEEEN